MLWNVFLQETSVYPAGTSRRRGRAGARMRTHSVSPRLPSSNYYYSGRCRQPGGGWWHCPLQCQWLMWESEQDWLWRQQAGTSAHLPLLLQWAAPPDGSGAASDDLLPLSGALDILSLQDAGTQWEETTRAVSPTRPVMLCGSPSPLGFSFKTYLIVFPNFNLTHSSSPSRVRSILMTLQLVNPRSSGLS